MAIKPKEIGVELLPCNGCGKVPNKISRYHDYYMDGYFVRCNRSSRKCPAKPMTYVTLTPERAAMQWNKINSEM